MNLIVHWTSCSVVDIANTPRRIGAGGAPWTLAVPTAGARPLVAGVRAADGRAWDIDLTPVVDKAAEHGVRLELLPSRRDARLSVGDAER